MSPYGAGEPAVTQAIGNVGANPAYIDHLSPAYATPVRLRGQSESPTGIPDAEYLPMSTKTHIDPKIHLAGAQDGEYLLQLNQLSVINNGQVHTRDIQQDNGSFGLAGATRQFDDIQSLIEYYSSSKHLSDAATKHRDPDFPVKLATVKSGTV